MSRSKAITSRRSLPGYASAIQLFENGHERFLLPHAVPMLGIEGAVIGVCVILVDVTALRSADEAKSNLVSTVSHELRTPLTSIRMAMNLLHDPKFGPARTQTNRASWKPPARTAIGSIGSSKIC